MTQHPIDLLPDDLRQRSLAGVRAGQSVGAFVAAIVLLVVLSTHSHVRHSNAQQVLDQTSAQANKVIECEQKAERLRASLDEYQRLAHLYDEVALPVDLSRIIATIASELPESLTLDRLDLLVQAGSPEKGIRKQPAPVKSASPEATRQTAPTRYLIGELSGLATTDQTVAGFVKRLEQVQPLERISLDYIRSRKLHEHMVQEFRLSFRINLDRRYVVSDKIPAAIDSNEDSTLAPHD